MPRPWVLVQLLVGWLPVGVLLTLLVLTAHHTTAHEAIFVAARGVIAGVVTCIPLFSLTKRWPWPDRLNIGFVTRQIVAAAAFGGAFVFVNSVIESIIRRQLVVTVGIGLVPFLITGMWLYVMVVGVIYANEATGRAARAEALAARSQLAALRSQLNPHFLFNALHTIVHLIPQNPARASSAAEEVAGLLRTTLENDRDLVPLRDELEFVRRYLAIERIRFGDRLCIDERVDSQALDAFVPVFSVQTLVENAVRHGAAPSIEPTTVGIHARRTNDSLAITVSDDGVGDTRGASARSSGSGLNRLRDQLSALYASRARLSTSPNNPSGWVATFELPFDDAA